MTLGRNILWNFVGFLWLMLLVILITPYMIRHLGLDAFGVWSVIVAVIGYLSALDLGVGNALIRFLAVENERRDPAGLEAYLRSGLTLLLLLGGLAGGILVLLSPALARRWLEVPAPLVQEAVVSFRLGALSVFLWFLVVGYGAVLAALRRFDLMAVRTVLLFTLQYTLFVLSIRLGGGLRGIVIAHLLGLAVVLGFLLVALHRILPEASLIPGWRTESVVRLLRFGRFKFAGQLSETLLRELDRVAIAVMLPVGRVPFYAVPLRLSQRITQIVEQIATPFYPAMTSQFTGGRQKELQSQYKVGTRLVVIVAFGVIAVLGGLAEPILDIWLGADFARNGTWVLRILLLAYAAAALSTLPGVAASGADRPGIPAGFMALGAVLHVPLVLLGTHLIGITGAALGVLAGYLAALIGVGVVHARVPGLPSLLDTLKEVRGVILAGSLTLAGTILFAGTPFPDAGVVPLLITILLSGVTYLAFLILFRGVSLQDARRVLAVVQRH